MGKGGKSIKSVMMHLLRLESAGKGWSEDEGNGRKRKMGENGCPRSVLTVVRIHEGARGKLLAILSL